MNTAPLHHFHLPGFKVVPKHHLHEEFRPDQGACYVLLGVRGAPDDPTERVLFVHHVDHFLDSCERQIEKLWEKHRVLITHVAVRLARVGRGHGNLTAAYERAVELQQLRQKLHPRFRRL
jgi:hypothetical protein